MNEMFKQVLLFYLMHLVNLFDKLSILKHDFFGLLQCKKKNMCNLAQSLQHIISAFYEI